MKVICNNAKCLNTDCVHQEPHEKNRNIICDESLCIHARMKTKCIDVGLSFGESDECAELAKLAATMPCFSGVKIISADFVWGETVKEDGTTKKMGKSHAHITGTDKDGNDVYRTLCGINELGGNWSFSFPYGDEPDKDECKKCRKVWDRLKGRK